MEMTTSTLETTDDNLTSYLTDLNSIDYPSAITQWLNAQYAYQASLQVAASSMNMSLLNYL
jgi:flagellin-like hook-associated protein FlgL